MASEYALEPLLTILFNESICCTVSIASRFARRAVRQAVCQVPAAFSASSCARMAAAEGASLPDLETAFSAAEAAWAASWAWLCTCETICVSFNGAHGAAGAGATANGPMVMFTQGAAAAGGDATTTVGGEDTAGAVEADPPGVAEADAEGVAEPDAPGVATAGVAAELGVVAALALTGAGALLLA